MVNKKKPNEVESFINAFISSDTIKNKFLNGYCWHFAHMLQDTFHRGLVCWAAPEDHFVWKDNDDALYDANGIYQIGKNKAVMVPEWYIEAISPDFLKGFKHIPGIYSAMSDNETANIYYSYLRRKNK